MTDTAKLRAIFRARVETLVDDLVDVLVDRVESTIGQALDAARSALESDLHVKAAVVPAIEVAEEPADGLAAVVDAELKRRAPSSRTNTCRKCGAIGFTARTCGKTHNISAAPASLPVGHQEPKPAGLSRAPAPSLSVEDDEDDEETDEKNESPPPVAPRNRFAAIEEAAQKRAGVLPVPRSTFAT